MSARDEALRAIEHVEKMLTGPELTALGKRQCAATLEYAKEQVAAIEEVKRPRKPKAERAAHIAPTQETQAP